VFYQSKKPLFSAQKIIFENGWKFSIFFVFLRAKNMLKKSKQKINVFTPQNSHHFSSKFNARSSRIFVIEKREDQSCVRT